MKFFKLTKNCDFILVQNKKNFNFLTSENAKYSLTRFGYYGPLIKFCGWAYEMIFCTYLEFYADFKKRRSVNRSSNH